MGADIVGRGRSSLTRKPPLFCLRTPPRYEPYVGAGFLPEIFGSRLDAPERVDRNTPPVGQITNIDTNDDLTFATAHQLGMGRPTELIPEISANAICASTVIFTVPAPNAFDAPRITMRSVNST